MRLTVEKHFPHDEPTWPTDARQAMSALDRQRSKSLERRSVVRHVMRVAAELRLDGSTTPIEIFVKDVNAQFMGFICKRPLGRGARGVIRVADVSGMSIELVGTVGRCRPFMDGWYEGFITFDEPEDSFDRAA